MLKSSKKLQRKEGLQFLKRWSC